MKRLLFIAILLLLSSFASSQPRTAWAKYYRGPYTGSGNWNCGYGVFTDPLGNVYVGGYGPGASGYYEMTAVKYTPKGEEAWVRRWNSPEGGNAYVYAMAMDKFQNVYLAGCTDGYDAHYNKVDQFTVVAFSAKGETLWTSKPFKESSVAWGVAVDAFGRVSATGDITISSQLDVITVSLDFLGDTLWTSRFDFHTVIDSLKPQNDSPNDMAVDAFGDIFVLGYTDRDTSYNLNKDVLLLRYSPEGVLRTVNWSWGFASRDDWGDAIRIDNAGHLAWVGTSKGTSTSYDFFISNGDWLRRFDGNDHGEDWAYDVALDSHGDVITVGRSQNLRGDFDFAVVKYSKDGDSLWMQRYDGPGQGEDRAFKVAVDARDNIYVTGVSDGGFTEADWATIKYSADGEFQWVVRQEGLYEDWPGAITVRGKDVYVTGRSGPFGENDMLTIRYVQDRFRPERDGWQFANTGENMWPQTWWSQFDYTKPPYPFFLKYPPINATSADFPDWPLFVDVYGTDQCYKKAGDGSDYFMPMALLKWRCMVGTMKERDTTGNITSHWGGSCAGFCFSALRYYNDLLSLQWTLGDYDKVYNVPISDNSRYLVNRHYVTYLGNDKPGDVPPVTQVFGELKTMLVENYANTQWLALQDAVTNAGHAVVACSLAAVGSGWWELSVYDPNHPGTYMHLNYSEITEEWSAEEEGWNNLLLWLNPIESFSQRPMLSVAAEADATPVASADSSISIFNSSYANIRIRDAAGQTIGFADGAVIDSMPGAHVRIHFGGGGHPPGGYFLPPGDYTASIGSSLDRTTYFAMFLDSAAFSFHRQGAGTGDNEVLRFSTAGRDLSVTNPDQGSKPLFLQSIEILSGEQTVCRLHVQAMPAGDSLGIRLAGKRDVEVLVGSKGMTADLRLELAKDYANPVFQYAGLMLEGGAAYLVAPVWDSLATIPLRIYVDRDRDGTADDTLRLENQPADVPQGRHGQIPGRFELRQNYPNPFNSGTLITYEVPEKSNVRLSVFDILGREVAVLVDEQKAPGVYTLRFDASNLSSGTYLCRLTAGSYVQTRKWLLVR